MSKINVKTYIGIQATLAVSLAASWVYWYGVDWSIRLILASVVFGVLLCLVGSFPIKVTDQGEIDATDVVQTATVVLLGPVWAMVAALPLAILIGARDSTRTTYEASRVTIEVFLAGIVFSLASQPLLIGDNYSSTPLTLYATFGAALTILVVNAVSDTFLLKIKYGKPLKEVWRTTFEPYLLPAAINILTTSLGVLALLIYGPVAAIVVVAGSIVSQVIVYRSRDKVAENVELKARVASLEESLAASNLAFGTMVISDLGRKDGYTHLHAAATSVYAADIAAEMDFDAHRQSLVGMAGLLHNIGFFGMPDEVLTATGDLNSVARRTVEEHPARGEAALNSVPEFREMAGWVRWHHERPDGRGYPDRLRLNWIPLEARILAVAQAYAAMVLDQPRRPKMDFSAARSELNAGNGTQLDEVVVRAFLRILDTESEGYRMADDYRFSFPASEDVPTPASRPVSPVRLFTPENIKDIDSVNETTKYTP